MFSFLFHGIIVFPVAQGRAEECPSLSKSWGFDLIYLSPARFFSPFPCHYPSPSTILSCLLCSLSLVILPLVLLLWSLISTFLSHSLIMLSLPKSLQQPLIAPECSLRPQGLSWLASGYSLVFVLLSFPGIQDLRKHCAHSLSESLHIKFPSCEPILPWTGLLLPTSS